MNKLLTWILMLCLTLSGALSYASDVARTMNGEGTPILTIAKSQHGGTDRSSTIQASIDGHYLTVTFTQDIGTLAMELDKVSGPMIFSYPSVQTPDGYQFYLPLTGDYIITFTLANGDEYYGEFMVSN